MTTRIGLLLGLLVLPIPVRAQTPTWEADNAGHAQILAPFLQQHCERCHNAKKARGEFRLDTQLPNNFLDPAAAAKWREVVNVLNSHEMPPKAEPQPKPADTAKVVDWITTQTVRAELLRRDGAIVLRRLNRDEYRNTIRDLIGIDFDTSGFPQDPPAGGFDNNGRALTVSPLHLELYLNAARHILDRALVEGPQPTAIKWHFAPKPGPGDRIRQRLDPKNNAIVNGGENGKSGDWVVIHHNSWNKHVGARDFRVPTDGTYLIRLHAAGRVPKRKEVVASTEGILKKRQQEQDEKNPKGKPYHQDAFNRDLLHFQTDRIYDYGAPRVKLVQQLGPTPRTIAEFDIPGTLEQPTTHEVAVRFTTESAGVGFEYAYNIPSVLENFWLQGREQFARPELFIDWFEIEGPVYPSWPPPSHTNILFASPLRQTDERAYAREVLARFMAHAYRRPVTPAEIDGKLKLYDRAKANQAAFLEAIKQPLIAVLTAPHFLYLAEPAPAQSRPLTDHEFASRLSYFLWSSQPDAELRRAADSGQLRTPNVLRTQVNRLLADPKSAAFVRNFAGQWLSLREVGNNPPATDLFPQYDRHLETSIVGEAQAFFAEILHKDLSVRNFIKSDFVVINERLARFYGIPGVKGDQFRAVPVPPGVERGGIATMAAVLTITSNGTRTSPVKRGTWVLKNLLGIDPGLPVANAGEIAPKVPGIDKATVRKRLEIHRSLEQCARCHNKIDPLGFALENFNAAGEWRAQEGFGYKGRIDKNDPKIDASATMPDGTPIVGVAGLQQALLAKEELFLGCLANKLLTYALGREMGLADQPLVQAAVAATKREQYTLRGMIQHLVASEAFGRK